MNKYCTYNYMQMREHITWRNLKVIFHVINKIFNVSVDKSLKIFSITEKIQKRSATISNLVRK